MRPLSVDTLSVRGFRNLDHVDVEPGPRFNVISGDNGQGKTNLLEAIYALATSKSFRSPKPSDLVAYGGEVASVRASIREAGVVREQSVGLKAGVRAVRVDGKRPPTLFAYAVRTPVVVFHPGEISLSMGAGGERRRLLDRIALYLDGASSARPGQHLDEIERYSRALRERQRALETRGPDARDLDGWEDLTVRHGLAVTLARQDAARGLAEAATRAFERIAAPGTHLEVRYAPSAPLGPERYREALAANRAIDLRRRSARVGPHRDDLTLTLAGHPARGFASQGQHRAIVLSLKAAEIEVVGGARDVRPILLLDDVSSELDRARSSALFSFLQAHEGQVFLTTTRPEIIDTGAISAPSIRCDFTVRAGVLARQEA